MAWCTSLRAHDCLGSGLDPRLRSQLPHRCASATPGRLATRWAADTQVMLSPWRASLASKFSTPPEQRWALMSQAGEHSASTSRRKAESQRAYSCWLDSPKTASCEH